jgi:molybdopterin synthase catalytic subunit
MRVRVLFFGRLKDIVGRAEDETELTEGARVEDLFACYGARFPELERFRGSVVASVNQDFARWTAPLAGGDEVAFLPPVSGGDQQETTIADDLFELVHAPIDVAPLVAHVKGPADGAVVVFDGTVRNNTRGRATQYLVYEAYEPMALKMMREIGAQIREQFAVHRIAIVHRLGRLEIGETSVLIAVSAPHRDAAFDASRFAIETLKRTVPIWKKEYFTDGALWVEGHMPGQSDAQSFSGSDESTS